MGPQHWHLISHPKDVQYVLRDNFRNFARGMLFGLLEPMLGQGLLTSDGQSWLEQRRLLQPIFHRQRIAGFAASMVETTEAMLDGWAARARNGEPVDIASEMWRLTLANVGHTLLDLSLRETASTLESAFSVMLGQIYHRATHPFALPVNIPLPGNLRFKRARQHLDHLIYQLIHRHQVDGRESDSPISMLLEAYQDESDDSTRAAQVRDQVMTLLFAGHETTASALTWTWYLLAHHADVERQLHDELAQVLKGRVPAAEDLPKLQFTKSVIQESMRLYPPVWGIPRTALTEDEIGGYCIPANSVVVVSQFVTHRHPEFWHQPDTFKPARFSPEVSGNHPAFAYFPFGEGAHRCIGKEFALMEAQLVLARVSQRYRLRPLSAEAVTPDPSITLRPKGRLLMRLEEPDWRDFGTGIGY